MRKRRLWRTLLAGAVIGLVEGAGLDRARRGRRRPLRAVWLDDREPADPLARVGVWFLDPLFDPRPAPGDLRRTPGPALRITAFDLRRVLCGAWLRES
ncbi:MAG TPA: hypothetical protein VMM12_11375 [Longimicrobiales bacterium]|nr:hypothetical protein [Longimicrobiales bacterium]